MKNNAKWIASPRDVGCAAVSFRKDFCSQKQIKKAIDALIRRGHSYGNIRRVLNELSFDAEDYFED